MSAPTQSPRERAGQSLRIVSQLARTCADTEALKEQTLRAVLDDIALYAERAANEAEGVVQLRQG